MDTDEINRRIYTEILGLCLHKWTETATIYFCGKCGDDGSGYPPLEAYPDYCNDLNLVRAAEEKVIEMIGEPGYAALVMQETSIRATGQNWTSAVTASAKERCLAILKAGRAE